MADRYQAKGVEAEFEPGSRGRVLRNLLGIRSARDIAQVESEALLKATERSFGRYTIDHRFTAEDVCAIHRDWLGDIYAWAGEYRNVNIAKGNFRFAAAAQIPRLMHELERGALATFTPCHFERHDDIAHALAVVHAELVLVHPFREGNGRCARIVSALMSLQAGLPPLDFGGVTGKKKRAYISAIHAAMGRDYEPMTSAFRQVVDRTLRVFSDEKKSWRGLSEP